MRLLESILLLSTPILDVLTCLAHIVDETESGEDDEDDLFDFSILPELVGAVWRVWSFCGGHCGIETTLLRRSCRRRKASYTERR
jgi:hypothetical protein